MLKQYFRLAPVVLKFPDTVRMRTTTSAGLFRSSWELSAWHSQHGLTSDSETLHFTAEADAQAPL